MLVAIEASAQSPLIVMAAAYRMGSQEPKGGGASIFGWTRVDSPIAGIGTAIPRQKESHLSLPRFSA